MTLPDITRNRHRGSATSEAANRRVHPHKPLQRESVLAFIAFMGSYGATCKEVTQILKIGYTSASPRITELKEEGLIACNGNERDGAWVYVATGIKKEVMSSDLHTRHSLRKRMLPLQESAVAGDASAEKHAMPVEGLNRSTDVRCKQKESPGQTSLFAERPQ